MSWDARFTFIAVADPDTDYRCELHGNELCFETLCLKSNATSAARSEDFGTYGKPTAQSGAIKDLHVACDDCATICEHCQTAMIRRRSNKFCSRHCYRLYVRSNIYRNRIDGKGKVFANIA